MKTFMKFNLISFLFGAFFFTGITLFFDQMGLAQSISWLSARGIVFLSLILFVAGTILIIYFSPNYFKFGKWMYLFVVSWLPYFRLLNWLFLSLFPRINPNISGGGGFVFALMFFSYPIYVWLMIALGSAINYPESPEVEVK